MHLRFYEVNIYTVRKTWRSSIRRSMAFTSQLLARTWVSQRMCCIIPVVREYPWLFVHIQGYQGYPWSGSILVVTSRLSRGQIPTKGMYYLCISQPTHGCSITILLTTTPAAGPMVPQILALVIDPLTCYVTSLSLSLFGHILVTYSVTLLSSRGH